MADVKDLLKMLAQPVLIAGAAGFGGRWANNKYKMGLNPWIAGVGGAAIGYVIGKGLQSWINKPAAAPPALPAEQQAAMQGPPRHREFQFGEPARALPPPSPAEYNTQYVPASETLQPKPDPGPPELDEVPDGIFTGAGAADFDDGDFGGNGQMN